MLGQPFMQNALLAGTLVGAACGLAGWFLVLRAQVFAGDALSHVAFTGALGAAALGVDPRAGLFAATIVVGIGMGGLGDRARADDVTIGTVFAWILGLGVLFLTIFTTSGSAGNGTAAVRVLFGSLFGLTRGDAVFAVVVSVASLLALVAIARPLLFASVDPDVAAARGVRVTVLGLSFLGILGVVAGEATQAIGALLLLGLVAAPAAAAHELARTPYAGMGLAVALAIACVWGGLALSYEVPKLPPSTAVVSLATVLYVGAAFVRRMRRAGARLKSGTGSLT